METKNLMQIFNEMKQCKGLITDYCEDDYYLLRSFYKEDNSTLKYFHNILNDRTNPLSFATYYTQSTGQDAPFIEMDYIYSNTRNTTHKAVIYTASSKVTTELLEGYFKGVKFVKDNTHNLMSCFVPQGKHIFVGTF